MARLQANQNAHMDGLPQWFVPNDGRTQIKHESPTLTSFKSASQQKTRGPQERNSSVERTHRPREISGLDELLHSCSDIAAGSQQQTQKIGQYRLDKENLIAVGVFAHVYVLEGERVRKIAAPGSSHLDLALKSIHREGEIYSHLGAHSRVLKCIARGDGFIDLEYAPNGHIESYIKNNRDISNECRLRFGREIIEAVIFIHSKGIIHSDLAARQFLLDSRLDVKISDFGFSSLDDGDVLGWENASHHLPRDLDEPSTVQFDLFALGSTLYEVMAGKRPYEDEPDDVITSLYSVGHFPSVDGLLGGDVILGCWKGRFRNAEEVLKHFPARGNVT